MQEIIAQRERMAQKNPDDLNNIIRLANLYERADAPTQAETRFKYVYDKASDKLMAGRVLAAFMARHGRAVEGEKYWTKPAPHTPIRLPAGLPTATTTPYWSPSRRRRATGTPSR